MIPYDKEPREEPRFITAEDAIIDMEMVTLGMRDSGQIGHLEGDEARKLAEYLFAGEEDGLPEELRRFFDFPEEK